MAHVTFVLLTYYYFSWIIIIVISAVFELTSFTRNETTTQVEYVDDFNHARIEYYFPDNTQRTDLYHFDDVRTHIHILVLNH